MAVRINMIANILSYRYTWNIFAEENFIASPILTPKTETERERDALASPFRRSIILLNIAPC